MTRQVYTLPLPALRTRLLRRLGDGWRAGFSHPGQAAWIGTLFDAYTEASALPRHGLDALFRRPDISTLLLMRHARHPYAIATLRAMGAVAPPKSLYLVVHESHFLPQPPFVVPPKAYTRMRMTYEREALGDAFGGWVLAIPPVASKAIETEDGRRQWVEALSSFRGNLPDDPWPVVMLTNPWLCRPSVLRALHEAQFTVGVHLHPQMSPLFAQWRAWAYLGEFTETPYPLYLFWHQSPAFAVHPRPQKVVPQSVVRAQLSVWIMEALQKGASVTLWVDDDAEGLAPKTLEGVYEALDALQRERRG